MNEGRKNLWNLCLVSIIASSFFLYFNVNNIPTVFDGVIYYSAGFCLLVIPIMIGVMLYKKKIIEGVKNGY